MSSYERVPTNEHEADEEPLSLDNPHTRSTLAEFNRPAPAWWKRALILAAIVFFGWLAVKLGALAGDRSPKVIYADRYSDEFKYRPAASPVITEHLADGRIRLRGATPGGVGVRKEDLPKTPADIRREKEQQKKEAQAKAKDQLRESKRKRAKKGRKARKS